MGMPSAPGRERQAGSELVTVEGCPQQSRAPDVSRVQCLVGAL